MSIVKGRTNILNHLIKKNNYNNYLEIGIGCNTNFNNIDIFNKTGVDPVYDCNYKMTSDRFFEILLPEIKYDIVFIDGLHYAEQLLKDIVNSINNLKEGGTIVCHDCNPLVEEHQQRRPHPIVGQTAWTGDCWKAIWIIKHHLPCIADYWTVDCDWGCCILKPSVLKADKFNEPDVMSMIGSLSFVDLDNNRKDVLNLISLQEFYENFN
jgi:hypothetical protein